ncbi:hypothetical protein PIB30_023967 [Stylosanthes scabra]|uniref:V-type proton ATPase subunit G n=1 Tax=Stylosanthes scabra TaxID=79078 RepID=A0ABU6X764_9FABA|nr:hypothetical protein [Stylosanthes scabra]
MSPWFYNGNRWCACVLTPPPPYCFLIVTPTSLASYVKSIYFYTDKYFGSPLLGKLARLKQAKDEAENKIAEHRAQLGYEFKKKVSESTRGFGANVKRLEQETDSNIHHLKFESSRISSGDVDSMLFGYVTTLKN